MKNKIDITLSVVLVSCATAVGLVFSFIPLMSLLVGIPLSILALVFSLISHYHMWDAVPEHLRRTTPGKAVGFLFIPFFNLYWLFPSYAGLADDVSKVTGHPSAAGLGIAYAILSIASWLLAAIPLLGSAILIARYVVWLLFVIRIAKDLNSAYEPLIANNVMRA